MNIELSELVTATFNINTNNRYILKSGGVLIALIKTKQGYLAGPLIC